MLQAVTKVLIKHSDYNLIASNRVEVRFVTTGGSVNFLPVVYISQENSIFSCMISTEVLRSLIYLFFCPRIVEILLFVSFLTKTAQLLIFNVFLLIFML